MAKLKEAISTIGETTTKEMLVEKEGVEDKKVEKEIIEQQQQLNDDEDALKMEMSQSIAVSSATPHGGLRTGREDPTCFTRRI